MDAFSKVEWECDFCTHPTNSPLVGLFIESRDHPLIEYALRNFSCMLPFASLYVMHSKQNEATIKRVIGTGTRVHLELLPDGFGELDCNLLKLSPDLWSRFMKNFDKVLIFNVDTGIKHNSILRFMHYDYIGAAWNHYPVGDQRVFQGNGGFSLRSRRLMEVVATDPAIRRRHPEDRRICRDYRPHLEQAHGIRFAPEDVARRFSIEGYGQTNRTHTTEFGFHGVRVKFAPPPKAAPPARRLSPGSWWPFRRRGA